MLKTVGRYETEEKIFVIKVRTKQEPACVNIIDTTDEYFEEFAIIPVDSDLEPCEEYTEKRKQQRLVEHQQDHSSDQGESSRSSESCRMQSPNVTAGKTFSVGDKGAAVGAGAKRRPQICEMCGKVVSNITQHLKHHDKEKEMCQVCCRPVRKVLRHRHSCNLKLYGCSCGVSFALKGEIEAHMREYGATKASHKFQCRRCPALLASTDEFDGHLAAVHKILICLQCYKQFLTPEALAVHIENHAVREVIKCTICSVELASRESLNRHVNNIHLTQEKIVCPLCCTSFTAKDNLRRHIEAVHGDRKDFICTVCGKLFSQASSVTRHMVIHSDLRPFRCAFCFQSFKLPRDLRKHNAAHREFMIRCPSCESFHLNQQELSLHLKRHPSHRKFGEGGYLIGGGGKSSS